MVEAIRTLVSHGGRTGVLRIDGKPKTDVRFPASPSPDLGFLLCNLPKNARRCNGHPHHHPSSPNDVRQGHLTEFAWPDAQTETIALGAGLGFKGEGASGFKSRTKENICTHANVCVCTLVCIQSRRADCAFWCIPQRILASVVGWVLAGRPELA